MGNASVFEIVSEYDIINIYKGGDMRDIELKRAWAMPNKNTFDITPIRKMLGDEVDTDYNLDALDFLKIFDDCSVDGVLYDPPYSPRQISECYKGVGLEVSNKTTQASFWSNQKKEISRIVKVGGKVISFGWNSGGIGMKYGFEIERILLVAHGGWHNDTICTIERKTRDV